MRVPLLCRTRQASAMHDAREYDAVVASGEQVTAGLLAIVLQSMGIDARSWLGWQIPIRTSGAHGAARIEGLAYVFQKRPVVGNVLEHVEQFVAEHAAYSFAPIAAIDGLTNSFFVNGEPLTVELARRQLPLEVVGRVVVEAGPALGDEVSQPVGAGLVGRRRLANVAYSCGVSSPKKEHQRSAIAICKSLER